MMTSLVKTKRLVVFFFLIIPVWSFTKAQDSDTTVKELKELVVKADRGWIEKDKIVYIPSRTEKKISNSPATLIDAMHLPMLKIRDGKITTVGGDKVAIFINGTRADATDLSTFWPADALRVEYLENPVDPAYQGEPRVVNFVMHKYNYGGNTSLSYRQNFPNSGYGNISSKLAFKRFTLGVMAAGGYGIDNRDRKENETVYSDLFYANQYYPTIKQGASTSQYRNRKFSTAVLSGLLKLEKFEMTHNFSWEWQDNLSRSNSANNWEPHLFDSEKSESREKTIYNLLSAFGNYYWRPNTKWTLGAGWWYTHKHEGVKMGSKMADLPVIDNSAIEDVDAMKIAVLGTYAHTPTMQFQVSITSSTSWYDIQYQGSTDAVSHLLRNENSGYLSWYWRPVNTFSFVLRPGVNTIMNRIEGVTTSSVIPTIAAQVTWDKSRKFRLSVDGFVKRDNPPASEYSPVLIRTSELIWTQGNPHLSPNTYCYGRIFGLWLPIDRLSISGMIYYDKIFNPYFVTYSEAPEDKGGLIMTSYQGNPYEHLSIPIDVTVHLFKHALNINLAPEYVYSVSRPNKGKVSLNAFSFIGSADYTLGNCNFKIVYNSPRKSLVPNGTGKIKVQGDFDFSFTWGNGNLYISAYLKNILHKKTKNITDEILGNLSTHNELIRSGRSLSIEMSYKFGYGKKFQDNLNITTGEGVGSSIRGRNL